MKTLVLLVLAVVQLSSAQYNRFTTSRYSQNGSASVSANSGEPFVYAKNWQAALAQAKAEGKSILVLSHLKNCRACKALLPDVAKNAEAQKLIKANYVVVHSCDGSDPYIDGLGSSRDKYYPRLFVYDSNGKWNSEIINDTYKDTYPYYFASAFELIPALKAGAPAPSASEPAPSASVPARWARAM